MGKRAVLRLLWDARNLFMDGDWSVYCRIIWEDYIIWGQGCRDHVLTVLAGEMENIHLELKEIGFELGDEINVD